mgnify:CR=1 FL=1
MSCPLEVKPFIKKISVHPTLVSRGQQITIESAQDNITTIYNSRGQQLNTYTLPAGSNSIPAPDDKGIYIIRTEAEDDTDNCKIIVD